jgi:hypothetical protein
MSGPHSPDHSPDHFPDHSPDLIRTRPGCAGSACPLGRTLDLELR